MVKRALCRYAAVGAGVVALIAAELPLGARVTPVSPTAQEAPPPRTAESVRALRPFAAASRAKRQTELTVRWIVAAPPAGAAAAGLVAARSVPEINGFEILKRGTIDEGPVRERDPQIALDEVVIVAVDAQGQEIGWQHLKDPRIVRSEQAGPGGLLTGQVFYRTETELVVRVPDDVAAVVLRVYEVQWNGREFLLRGLGTIPIGPR